MRLGVLNTRLRRPFLLCALVLLIGRSAEAASLLLAWDPPTDGITTGYVIGYGTQSGNHTHVVDVGYRVSFTIDGLADGTVYYFVVQAYSATGAKSGPSAEVSGRTSSSSTSLPTGNTAPTISSFPDQMVPKNTKSVGPLPYTVTDAETAAAALTVTGSSSNVSLLSSAGIVFNGSGSTRSLTLNLPSGVSGSAVVTISVSDGQMTTPTSFVLTVANAPRSNRPRPRNLSATSDGQSIELTWDAASDPAPDASQMSASPFTSMDVAQATADADPSLHGYRIEIGNASGSSNVGSFTTGVTRRFSIRDLSSGLYYIRVRGVHSDGETDASNEVVVSVGGGAGGAGAPRNVQASLNGRVAYIQWNAPSEGTPDGYQLEAGSASGQSNLGTLQLAAAAFATPELPDGVYYVRIKALSGGALGPPSNEVSFSVGSSSQPCSGSPSAPTLTGTSNGSLIQLAWQAGAGGSPTSYLLEAGSAPGRSDLGTLTLDSNNTSLTAPVPNGTYIIRVIALNGCGASVPSPEVSVTIGGPTPILPGAPGNLVHDVSGAHVSFSWSPPASGGAPSSYVIEATDASGNALATFDTGNLATSFSHDTVGAGVYVVRIRAANAAGVGPASASVTIVVQ